MTTPLTVKQISEAEKVPQRIVLRWIASGSLRARDMSERADQRPRWRIDLADWQAFCLSRTNTAPLPKRRRGKSKAGVIEVYR